MPVTALQHDAIEASLSHPDRKNLCILLGEVVRVRMKAENHMCHLISLLENNSEMPLAWYEEKCANFVHAIQSCEDAVSKVRTELVGPAQSCSRYEFNSKMADFFAEIAAVGEFSKRGGIGFVPLIPSKIKKGYLQSAPDFKFRLEDEKGNVFDAYLEVKNIRAPIGISDTFHQIYSELSYAYPALLRCFIRLTHYCDNKAGEEWRMQIEDFILDLASRPVAFSTTLTLSPNVRVDVDVAVVEGAGGVTTIRGLGGNNPEGPFINLEALKRKATNTVMRAIEQLSPYSDAKRIVALNISTADALLHESIIKLLVDVVQAQGAGKVDLFLMHHHHAVDVSILQ